MTITGWGRAPKSMAANSAELVAKLKERGLAKYYLYFTAIINIFAGKSVNYEKDSCYHCCDNGHYCGTHRL